MPERARRPRRRLSNGASDGDFTSEVAVREAAARVRARYPSAAEAEQSDEWRALRPRVARWVLRTSHGLPVVVPEDSALRIARIYLVRPEFLPSLPPPRSLHEQIDSQPT